MRKVGVRGCGSYHWQYATSCCSTGGCHACSDVELSVVVVSCFSDHGTDILVPSCLDLHMCADFGMAVASGDRIETTDLVVRYEVGASQVFGPMQIDSCSDQVPETSTWPCASPNNNCGAENTALIQINASQSGDGLFRGTLCAGTSDGYPAAGTVAYNVLIEKVASYPAGANHSARYISSQMVASYPAASSCTQDATIPDRDGMLGQYKQQEQRWRPLVSGEIEQDRIDAFDNEACLTSHPNASLHDYAADASASGTNIPRYRVVYVIFPDLPAYGTSLA